MALISSGKGTGVLVGIGVDVSVSVGMRVGDAVQVGSGVFVIGGAKRSVFVPQAVAIKEKMINIKQ
jgi:hypothetical protein